MGKRKIEDLPKQVEDAISKVREIESTIKKDDEESWAHITDVLQFFGDEKKKTHSAQLFATIKCCERIFNTFLAHFTGNKHSDGQLYYSSQKRREEMPESKKDSKFLRLRKSYYQCIDILLGLLEHQDPMIQVTSLQTLMSLVYKESISKSYGNKSQTMDDVIFGSIVRALVHNKNRSEELMDTFGEKYVAEYDDVRYYTYQTLRGIAATKIQARQSNSEYQKSEQELATVLYSFLENMEVPDEITAFFVGEVQNNEHQNGDDNESDEDDEKKFLYNAKEMKEQKKKKDLEEENIRMNEERLRYAEEGKKRKAPENPKKQKNKRRNEEQTLVGMETDKSKEEKSQKPEEKVSPLDAIHAKLNQLKFHKKVFQDCWLTFLRLSLPVAIYKKVLLGMEEDILPNMTKPILLSSFLTESYDIGGAISVLALSGLFILISRHKLDYPDFYKKLYALFDLNLFQVKYRARFFKLTELFLSSPLLPAYLIASFIKKLARLSLQLPPHGIIICMVLIHNLLQRNAACRVLIHRAPKHEEKPVLLIGATQSDDPNRPLTDCNGFDPFVFEETDPSKTHALDSSLWELLTFQDHYAPSVAKLSKIFEGELLNKQYNFSDFINESNQTIFDNETARAPKGEPALAFQKKTTLFSEEEEFSLWNFS